MALRFSVFSVVIQMAWASTSNSRSLLDTVDNSVTTINIPQDNNVMIGHTLDSLYRSGYPSPFTDESIALFEEAWNNKEPETYGTFTMATEIISSREERLEMLDISGSLSLSYMMFSGDAHMSFLNENIDCESDVSVIMKASSAGRKYQMSLSETNLLELKDTVQGIQTLDEFIETYGAYLIVGFNYGGEILFESTHSARNSEHKNTIEGGLSVSLEAAGFALTGSADIGYDKSDIATSIRSSTKYSIRPNVWTDETTELIKVLSSLSTGGLEDDDTLFDTLNTKAQELLSGEFVDPLQAVVIPLSSVGAVDEQFSNPDIEDTAAFLEFLNELYMEVEGLSKQLELVEQEWESANDYRLDVYPVPWQDFGDWAHLFTKLRSEMLLLNTMDEIISKSKVYFAALSDSDWNADVLTADSFIHITAYGLNQQFGFAIMDPYNDMLAITTAVPTPIPTPMPIPIPTPLPTQMPTEVLIDECSIANLVTISGLYYGSLDGIYYAIVPGEVYKMTTQDRYLWLETDYNDYGPFWAMGMDYTVNDYYYYCDGSDLANCQGDEAWWVLYYSTWAQDKGVTVECFADSVSSAMALSGSVMVDDEDVPDGTSSLPDSAAVGGVNTDWMDAVRGGDMSLVLSSKDLVIIVLILVSLVSMVCLIIRCQSTSTTRGQLKYGPISIVSESENEQLQKE